MLVVMVQGVAGDPSGRAHPWDEGSGTGLLRHVPRRVDDAWSLGGHLRSAGGGSPRCLDAIEVMGTAEGPAFDHGSLLSYAARLNLARGLKF